MNQAELFSLIGLLAAIGIPCSSIGIYLWIKSNEIFHTSEDDAHSRELRSTENQSIHFPLAFSANPSPNPMLKAISEETPYHEDNG